MTDVSSFWANTQANWLCSCQQLRYASPYSYSQRAMIMTMESAAVDELIDKGRFAPSVAVAIAKAIDLTIKAANLVTVEMLDARFAAFEAKMEARFGQIEARFAAIEKSIVSTKVWAVYLYASLVIALFSALALDHHWLVNREDQLMALSNQRFDAMLARSDQRFQQLEARFQQVESRLDGLDVRMAQIQALLTPVVRGQPATTQSLPTRSRPH